MRRRVLLATLAVLAALQAYVIYYSFTYGLMRGPLPWDDCAVILRAIRNLDVMSQTHSVGRFLAAGRHVYIHAPISDLQTIAGLLLTGGAEWGPYVLCAVWPAVALAALATSNASSRSAMFFVAASALLLTQPLTTNALWWLKSDWQGGVLLAVATFVLFDAAETNSARGKIIGSVLLSLSLLCKLTAFYQIGLALITFGAFEVYGAVKRRGDTGSRAPAAPHARSIEGLRRGLKGEDARLRMTCILIIILPYLAFFVHGGRSLIGYIQFGLNPLWQDHLTIAERIWSYLPTSHEARNAWGMLHVEVLLLMGLAAIFAALRRSWTQLGALGLMCGLILLFYLPLFVANTSQPSYASLAIGMVAGAALVGLGILQQHIPRVAPWLALAAIVALSPFTPLPFTNFLDREGMALNPAEADAFDALQADVVEEIERAGLPQPRLAQIFDHILAPHPNIEIRYFKETGRFLDMLRVDNLAIPEAQSYVRSANFALTVVPDGSARTVPNLYPTWPLSSDPAAGDTFVQGEKQFQHVKAYPIRGGVVHLYRATDAPSTSAR